MEYNLENVIAKRSNKTVYNDLKNGNTIKLFIDNYSKADILNEALNQTRVEESTNLKIAKLKEVTKIGSRWALVSEHIKGTSLEELMNKYPNKQNEYLETFVKIQLEVQSKNVPLLNSMKEKYKRRITNATVFDENTKYDLLQRLEGMHSEEKLCHGDFNPSNIIITKDGAHYIIDWAHVTKGNQAADAANTYLYFSLQNKNNLARDYLEEFSKLSKIDIHIIQRWLPIVAAIEYLKEKKEEKETLKKWIDVVEYL